MRAVGCCGILLVLVPVVLAVDIADELRPPLLPLARAQQFSSVLLVTVDDIASHYARPVEAADLLTAGLRGLYQSARQPVPPRLEKEIKAALANGTQSQLVTRLRQEIGDVRWLGGHDDLIACLREIARFLDPHTRVMTGRDLQRSYGSQPIFGLEIRENLGTGPLFVQDVVPGSPAQQAGVLPGDEIRLINGKPIGDNQETLAAISKVVYGYNPGEVEAIRLTVYRPRTQSQWLATLFPAVYEAEAVFGVKRRENNQWDFWLDGKNKIGLIRLATLERGSANQFASAIKSLKAEGLRGLILDLRWSPRGHLNESIAIALSLVGEKTVATIKSRSDPQPRVYGKFADLAGGDYPVEDFTDIPLVVLINAKTSGAAELIASAIRDYKRGELVGQRTRGKASVQTYLSLRFPGAGMLLTSGTFNRPSGKNLHRFPDSKPNDDWGVRPDNEVRLSPKLRDRLHEWWQWQTLRPGTAKNSLPLDDPMIDPQLHAGWRRLRQKLQ
ncbi:MAG: hypothetical protein KatS3mg105_2501 [Gemmatales bacterium]|nr:MAG: hypothetical protein KatS3mg105_2501 [Gemmatales bacterium]